MSKKRRKTKNSVRPPSGTELRKGMPTREEKAFYENPLRMLDAMGYKSKPTAVTYNILQQMATRNAVIASIIITRINQVSTFTKPARYSNEHTGYEIRLRDPTKTPTDEQKQIMAAFEMFLENCGFNYDPDRDDFDAFIRKLVRDSLTYDQATFEVIPDRLGRPAEFVAVDAATIRAASESYRPDEILPKNQSVKWVQVIDGTIKAWFTSSELAFGVRNPRTDINLQPYGFSELEQLIHQITSHLYAEEYNARFFSQGGTTKGIINLRVDPNGNAANAEQLESFKRQWRAQSAGLTGAWKTPVIQVPEGIDYINVSQSNREMEFEKWMNYLINIACAVYQIDPAEVNFPNNGGVGGNAHSLFDNGTEDKLKNSKDKGLRPLLRFVETLINKNLVSRFSQDYVFNFVGMDATSEKENIEMDAQRVKLYSTVNEIRKERGAEPIEHGDIILDPTFINYLLQMKQNASQSNTTNLQAGEYRSQNALTHGDIDSQEEDETTADIEDVAKSLDDYNIMEITIDTRLNGALAADLNKSDRSRLVPVQKMVTRDGKTYQTTVYVSPEEADASSKEIKENDEKNIDPQRESANIVIGTVPKESLKHISTGTFKDGYLKSGCHGQKGFTFLNNQKLLKDVRTLSNGVRIANVINHPNNYKREHQGQTFFPSSWDDNEIAIAVKTVWRKYTDEIPKTGYHKFEYTYKGVKMTVGFKEGKPINAYPNQYQ